jgi:hypothetical protein
MSGSLVMLVVGFLAGGVAASVVWAVVVSGRRRAVEAQRIEREQIMASVGEALAEADAIETNFRSGAATADSFRRGIGDRVNAVMRLLRTNMHTLDAFFVKYAEHEACEYLRLIDNPERRKPEGARFPTPVFAADAEEDFAGEEGSAPAVAAAGAIVAIGAVDAEDFAPSEDATPPTPALAAPEEDDVEESEPETGIIDTAPAPPAPDPVPAADVEEYEDEVEEEYEEHEEHEEEGVVDGVNEEELVLGESADGVFEISAPVAAPPAPPPPAQGGETWTGGDSIDEFEESAYAQFEIPASPAPAPDYRETGSFTIGGGAYDGQARHAAQAGGDFDDHELTETSSIDKSAIQSAMAAAGQALPPIQTPLPFQTPEPPAPPPQAEQHQEQQENQGITGDDVVDSIDNFFKLG